MGALPNEIFIIATFLFLVGFTTGAWMTTLK